MDYRKLYRTTLHGRTKAYLTARMVIATFVVIALITALPMSSPGVDGARLINTFKDGETSMLIEFTTDPLEG